ncbi:condensation domain-containing protein [Ralstonia pseudosolanacearum]
MIDTEHVLLETLQSILSAPLSAADLECSLLALGADSLQVAALSARMHRRWGIRLSVGRLLQLNRLGDLLELLPAQTHQPPPAPVVEADREHQQSPVQAMVYHEHFRNPDTTAYNIPILAELPQPISTQQFSDALQQVAADLPVLFARFYDQDGRFLWRFGERREIPVQRFADLDEARKAFVQPFRLGHDVLLRAAIVPFDGRQTCLMLDFSHIVADGVSVGMFVERLKSALSGNGSSKPAPGGAMPHIWQADDAWHEQQRADRRFWQTLLQEVGPKPVWPGLPELPPRTAPGYGYAVQYTDLDDRQAGAFRALAKRSGSTPFTLALLLLALLQTQLLQTWRSHLGVVVSGRSDADTFESFGMFVNALILPLPLEAGMSLQAAIDRLHQRVLSALEHQTFPAAEQVQLCGGGRGDGSHPLLDVLFAFQNIDYQRIDLFGGRFRSFCEAKTMAQFGIVLHCFDLGAAGYQLQWEYCPHRFSHLSIATFSGMFVRLFQRLLEAEPSTTLGDLIDPRQAEGPAASLAATADFDFGD